MHDMPRAQPDGSGFVCHGRTFPRRGTGSAGPGSGDAHLEAQPLFDVVGVEVVEVGQRARAHAGAEVLGQDLDEGIDATVEEIR